MSVPPQYVGPGFPGAPQPAPYVPLAPAVPSAPSLGNGATVHGAGGIDGLKHPSEMPLVWVCGILTVVSYFAWLVALLWLGLTGDELHNSEFTNELRTWFMTSSLAQFLFALPALPLIMWIVRALLYAQTRINAIQLSPTQFPEAYKMLVEAANSFGLRRTPDAYVVLGNGVLNAFSAGHGFRRFVAINSDLLEVGGKARDPEALRFVIAHEVGHIAAGHVSYFRLLISQVVSNIPLLGSALSRAQEYTADNHGYQVTPTGAVGAMALLSGGKYLGAHVNFHALADRAAYDGGFWLHLTAWGLSHPPLTWRSHALRDRRHAGRLMIHPPRNTAWFPPSTPNPTSATQTWPSPPQSLAAIQAMPVGSEEKFGRYPGIAYTQPALNIQLADPNKPA